MKLIKVTAVSALLSDRGREKFHKPKSKQEEEEEGLSKEQCEALGIPYKEKEIKEEEDIYLEESDYDIVEMDTYIRLKDFIMVSNRDSGNGSTIFLKNAITVDVKETAEEVKNLINNYKND